MKINISNTTDSNKRSTKTMTTAATTKACGPSSPSGLSYSSENCREARTSNRNAVSFAEKAHIVLIPSHIDMEQTEKDELWRTDKEIKATEQDIVQTATQAREKAIMLGASDEAYIRRTNRRHREE